MMWMWFVFLFFILFLLVLNRSLRLKDRLQGVEKRLDDIEKCLDSGLNGLDYRPNQADAVTLDDQSALPMENTSDQLCGINYAHSKITDVSELGLSVRSIEHYDALPNKNQDEDPSGEKDLPQEKSAGVDKALVCGQAQASLGLGIREKINKYQGKIDRSYASLSKMFKGGNHVARLGVVMLFIGMVFFIRFVSQQVVISLSVRLVFAGICSSIMAGLGWGLRDKKPTFALVLQGGGLGMAYLTTYAAGFYFNLWPQLLAIDVLIAISALMLFLGVVQDSESFSVLSIIGALVAPIFLNVPDQSLLLLGAYYLIISLAVYRVICHKPWAWLVVFLFLGTAIVSGFWLVFYYQSNKVWYGEGFSLLFLMISNASIWKIKKHRSQLSFEAMVACRALLAASPLAFVFAQRVVLRDYPLYEMMVMPIVGLVYAVLAFLNFKKRWVWDSFSLIFYWVSALLVLACILKFSHGYTSACLMAVWSLGLLVVGRYANQPGGILASQFFCCFSTTGFMLCALYFQMYSVSTNVWAFSIYALILLTASYVHHQSQNKDSEGLFFWLSVLFFSVAAYWSMNATLFTIIVAVLSTFLSRKLDWKTLSFMKNILWLPSIYWVAKSLWVTNWWPSDFFLVILSGVCWLFCVFLEKNTYERHLLEYVIGFWVYLVAFSFGLFNVFLLSYGWGSSWLFVAPFVFPAIALCIVQESRALSHKHFALFSKSLDKNIGVPLCIFGLVGVVVNIFQVHISLAPMMYLPLLNAVDIVCLVLLIYIYAFIKRYFKLRISRDMCWAICAFIFLIWMSVTTLRVMSFWFGYQLSVVTLFGSTLFQASLTIEWAMMALALIVLSRIRVSKMLWVYGMALSLLTAAKAFLIDLKGIDGLERIIVFIGLGVIFLLIGYYSPSSHLLEEKKEA